MNENRCIFSLDGVTGMLIATILLLSILGFLTYTAIQTQANHATNYYDIKDKGSIKMFSTENAKHLIDAN